MTTNNNPLRGSLTRNTPASQQIRRISFDLGNSCNLGGVNNNCNGNKGPLLSHSTTIQLSPSMKKLRLIEISTVIILGLITILVVLHNGPHSHNNNDDNIGNIVELYETDSYFATPAIITDEFFSTNNNNEPPPPTKLYSLQNAITSTQLSNINSQNVHPYQPYEKGTICSCNISTLRKIKMIPCAIISHTIRPSSKLVVYQISYLNENDSLVYDNLPFSRVQRRRHVELLNQYDSMPLEGDIS